MCLNRLVFQTLINLKIVAFLFFSRAFSESILNSQLRTRDD